jgi:adenylate cyclase
VRITAQLIDTGSDSHLWSESYDRKLEDVFAIQDDIANCIVAALRMTLTPRERRAIQSTATSDPRAYDFYLRGRSYYNTMTKRGFTHALTLYQEAIERDPNYALAFAGIADVYSFLFKYGGATREIAGRALEASQRAVELDGDLAEAHTSRGLALSINHRHKEAEAEFEHAIQLKPSLYEAHYFYGRDSVAQGRNDKAARLFAQAVAIDPNNYEAYVFLATAYRKSDRPEDAKQAERRAVAVAEKHLELYPDDARALYLGAAALVTTGDAARAREWAERALEADPDEPSILYNVGCMYSLMGDKDRAITLIDEAVRKGFGYRAWLEQDGDLDPLRGDRRFQAVLDRLG